jgi:ATP-dependent RNA helicase RhlE
MIFSDLKLSEPILRALESEGYHTPTPIQAQAIPYFLDGRDILGSAQTGTGKTAAFTLPILQKLDERIDFNQRNRPIKALIITPTRELAIQIGDSIKTYGKYYKITSTVVFGGVNQKGQTDALRRGADIVVATPGRLLDLVQQGFIDLNFLDFFVLDEADRMLDMGFIHDVRRIAKLIPTKRQTTLFSATFPLEIQQLAMFLLNNPVKVEVVPQGTAAETVQQSVYLVDKKNKRSLLQKILKNADISEALVFTRTKHGADKVSQTLNKSGFKSAAIHGNKSQIARQKALNDFKAGKIKILVATDIAARGIDIDALSYVVNFDLPNEPETYVHRIGRTGRAGATGKALSFCDMDERPYLKSIHKLIRKELDLILEHDFAPANSMDIWEDLISKTPQKSSPPNRAANQQRRFSGQNGQARNPNRNKNFSRRR